MLEWFYRPVEKCLFGGGDGDGGGGGGGGGGGDELLWGMDLKPHACGGDYSIAVVQANSSLEDQGQVFTSPSATYVGIYDGHGGPQASRFITHHLFSYLQEFAFEEGGLSEEVIRKAFFATEERFLQFVKQSWMAQPEIASAGSCCLLGAISNNVLYVANVGDSRVVLGRRVTNNQTGESSTVVAERLSTDHNVGDEEVRKEVEALHPDDSHIVINTHGVWRIKGIIQVSRSIGDIYLKNTELSRDPLFQRYGYPIPLRRPVMSSEPSILIRKLKPQDSFLIFASDGLWEQLSDEAAVNMVLRYPRVGIAKRLVRAALEEAAKKKELKYKDIKKLEKGTRRRFHDDVTVIVLYLDHQKGFPGGDGGLKGGHAIVDFTSIPVDIFSLNSDQGDDTFPVYA